MIPDKIVKLLKTIEQIAKIEDEELLELLEDYPNAKEIVKYVNQYEKVLAKLLREEKKYFIQAIQQYLASDNTMQNPLVAAMVDMVRSDMNDGDPFGAKVSAESKTFLEKTVKKLTTEFMDSLDPDVPFETLSKRTTDWVNSWSDDLGQIMKISSQNAVTRAITETLDGGESIEKLVLKIKDLPEFDRNRARATAITETLTANSVAQQEAYDQSPAVTGKTWLHSGGAKNRPRPHHVALNGTTIPTDQKFEINSPNGMFLAEYPRDVGLPASERVRCHCVLAPSVDEDILGLSKEEKEAIRAQVLADLNA